MISFENLLRAAHAAARGKRFKPGVASFLFDLERQLLRLHEELAGKAYRPGPYRTFTIYEGKTRQISAAPFRDRVVTHYILRIATPLLAVVLLAGEARKSEAQDGVPVIKANSTTVDIQDGHNFRKGHWTVEPNLKIDIFCPQRSWTAKTVTFRTDIDSISFEVESGHDYDFVILLNGKNSCRTRISAMRRSCTMGGSYDLTNPAEIPFTLTGDN